MNTETTDAAESRMKSHGAPIDRDGTACDWDAECLRSNLAEPPSLKVTVVWTLVAIALAGLYAASLYYGWIKL